ncbi:MAG: peptide-methionine (S)-S-oxide reductase MsrA [Thiotrichaceae bacterium]|nr:peptide-methionine (S)-S-oxide reductase MsrA [Thiotrichaceae bacterium]
MELATFGGGCFWCTEALFQQINGVLSVESGYTGGALENPSYPAICKGTTGHAEVIQVGFDPESIAYEDLLRIHLSSHNPTTINQQGADRGTQYRSAIFPHNEVQRLSAEAVIRELQADYEDKIVTSLESFEVFYKAEDEHQNYYNNHAEARYCQIVIAPKLRRLQKGNHGDFVKSV